MNKILIVAATVLFYSLAIAEEDFVDADTEAAVEDEPQQQQESGPKKMSGMSILGNEETPKSLVIVPWKSSEMGDDIGLSDSLDDRAQPVDKEVFLRELEYYEIRSED